MSFSLLTLRVNNTPTPALRVGDRYWALAEVAPEALRPEPSRGLMNVFDHWERTEPLLVRVAEGLAAGTESAPSLPAPAELEDILTPLQYPRKVILTGGNYHDHMHNDGGFVDWEKETKIPVFFFKPPTTALVGQGKSVRYPTQSEEFDYELELAVVIGKTGRNLTLDNAMDHVAGYTIGIDLSARDWQHNDKHLAKFDLFAGKGFDDSFPLGPGIVPARFVDYQNLQLQFWSNGELRQNANTRDMMWTIPEQLVKITEHVTIEPGDVISTGSPAGVGAKLGKWTHPGDVLEAEITGLGHLKIEITKG